MDMLKMTCQPLTLAVGRINQLFSGPSYRDESAGQKDEGDDGNRSHG
jgi:hypothetical protein